MTHFGKNLVSVKSLFFDRNTVKNAVDTAIRKKLNWIGGVIRKTARRSIHNAPSHNAVSKAGSPPLNHTGLLKNYLFYSFDKSANSVVVGPVLLNAKGKDVPPILEYGGYATLKGRRHSGTTKKFITARPFMSPAFEKNKGKISSIWAGSVSK